jgi:hypothetical protein
MALYSHGRRAGEFITVMTMRRLRAGTAPKIISGMGQGGESVGGLH